MFTEEEFLKAVASFGEIIPDPIEYRLHYDDGGCITMCSYQNHPNNDQYLVVSQDDYDRYTQYLVDTDKKKLKKVVFDLGISVKLKKSTHGYAAVKNHAGLIIELDEQYKDIEYYDDN